MKAFIIGIILSFIAYKLYNTFRLPTNLKGIPRVPLRPYLISALKGESFETRFNGLVKPMLAQHKEVLLFTEGYWKLVIADSKRAREILSNPSRFLKQDIRNISRAKTLFTELIGINNIAVTDNEEWRRHRRIANPAFKRSWDTALFNEIVSDTFDVIDDTIGSEMDVNELSKNITLDTLGKGIFGYNFGAVKNVNNNKHLVLYYDLFRAVANPVYAILPFLEKVVPSRVAQFKRCTQFRNFLLSIIEERRQEISNGTYKDDLLTSIIQASQKEDDPLLDEEVISDLAVFYFAGHDTTANTLSSIVYFLAKHPEIQGKARKEVMEVLGNPSKPTVPTNEQTKSLKYLNSIIKEAMRIVTTAGAMSRFTPNTITLSDGTHVPDNTFVFIDNWAIHHDENVYPSPETFNPERFSEAHSPQEQQWMPFGYGSRMCIGMKFSFLELWVILATLLQKYQFTMSEVIAMRPYEVSSGGLLKIENNFITFHPLK